MTAATLRSRVIPANEYRRERWRNGLGWTRAIHAQPVRTAAGASDDGASSSPDWSWRLSIAEIERDAPFSPYAGVDRELLLLSGNGLRLRFDDGETVLLDPPHGRARFAGERGVAGELVDGRTQDFNLMWRRDLIAAELWLRPLVGPMVFFAEPDATWALHLVAGDARFDAASRLPALHTGDTAILAEPARTRFLLEGGGTLLAMRLEAIG